MQINLIHDVKSGRNPIPHILHQCDNVRLWPAIYRNDPISGIHHAHKQIIRNALKTGKKEVIICEDDILFTQPDSFIQFIDHKPKTYDLYLGGVSAFVYHKHITYFTGMFFYNVHERFYETFLNLDETKHLDYALKGLGDYKLHNPPLAITKNGSSIRTGEFENLDLQWKKVNAKAKRLTDLLKIKNKHYL